MHPSGHWCQISKSCPNLKIKRHNTDPCGQARTYKGSGGGAIHIDLKVKFFLYINMCTAQVSQVLCVDLHSCQKHIEFDLNTFPFFANSLNLFLIVKDRVLE